MCLVIFFVIPSFGSVSCNLSVKRSEERGCEKDGSRIVCQMLYRHAILRRSDQDSFEGERERIFICICGLVTEFCF